MARIQRMPELSTFKPRDDALASAVAERLARTSVPDLSIHPIFRQYAAAIQTLPLSSTSTPSLLMSPASSVASDLGSTLEQTARPQLSHLGHAHPFRFSSSRSDSMDSNASTILMDELNYASLPKYGHHASRSANASPPAVPAAPKSGRRFSGDLHMPSQSPSPPPQSWKQPLYRPASPPLCRITVLPGKCSALPRIADLRSGCADGMLLLSATACIVAKRERGENGIDVDEWHAAKRIVRADA